MSRQKGILLINLGTPDAPTVSAVRRYLKVFLSDRRVIDLPWFFRMMLLYLVILPFRPKKTARAYQEIWTAEGSPLLVYSQLFKSRLADELGEDYQVALAMRYGQPTLKSAIKSLQGCSHIQVLPLFPQFSEAASGSAIFAAKKALKRYAKKIPYHILPAFFDDAGYQRSMSDAIKRAADLFSPDFIVFSYHGLPERQLDKSGCVKAQCDRSKACQLHPQNLKVCYRAQCFSTTASIAKHCAFDEVKVATVFQSRLGRVQWIRPYTDVELVNLAKQGVKRLMVVCPSFVADCLETLEEINIRLRAQWMSLGGEDFSVVPCLNTDPEWVAAAANLVRK